MPVLLSIFLTLIVLCVVFSLLYWLITLVGNLLPPPIKQPVSTLLLILLVLMAICCLLDLVGIFGGRHLLINIR